MNHRRSTLAAWALGLCLASTVLGFDFTEATDGDLSDNRLTPTPLPLEPGANRVSASTILGDREYFTILLAPGLQLDRIVLEQYASSNPRAFLGFQAGNAFSVDAQSATPSDLLGYVHFGFDTPAGFDVLDDMAAAPGVIGFARPLPGGHYTFWANQTEPISSSYRLNFQVIPEPTLAFTPAVLMCRRRRH